MVSILFPQNDDGTIFIARDKTQKGAKSKIPPLRRLGLKSPGRKAQRMWRVEFFGILRCAQNDSKNLQRQRQRQRQMRGFFALLLMTRVLGWREEQLVKGSLIG
jgi:hypothetical protein